MENPDDRYVRWSDLEAAFRQIRHGEAHARPAARSARPRRKGRAGRTPETPGVNSSTTRERILVATAQLLSEKGYAGTRLSDVAEVAGLQAPAIYYYFPSREELIAEVMTTGHIRLLEHVERVLAALPVDSTPMDKICAAIAGHLEVELQLSEFATAVIRNAGQLPEDMRNRIHDVGVGYETLWRNLLAEAQACGQVRSDIDIRAARMLILGALNWTVEWWKSDKGAVANIIHTAQTLVRDGLERSRESTRSG